MLQSVSVRGDNEVYFGVGSVYDRHEVGPKYMGLFDSRGREYDYCAGVRPVISLKSEITEKEVPKIADRTEETWDFPINIPI